MKYGKNTLDNLSEDSKNILLKLIVDKCVNYAGDSYEDFAKETISLLRNRNLVDYGEEE